jgi:hypothetical protein
MRNTARDNTERRSVIIALSAVFICSRIVITRQVTNDRSIGFGCATAENVIAVDNDFVMHNASYYISTHLFLETLIAPRFIAEIEVETFNHRQLLTINFTIAVGSEFTKIKLLTLGTCLQEYNVF